MVSPFSGLHINLLSFAYVVIGKWQPQRYFTFVPIFFILVCECQLFSGRTKPFTYILSFTAARCMFQIAWAVASAIYIKIAPTFAGF